jgi:ribosomal protein S27AE
VEPSFFDDLNSKIIEYNHYFWVQSIKRIIGPKNEDYDITNWNFLWAFDDQRRMFQFLFQKVEEQGILVGLAPPELSKLFSDHGKGAILRTFSLLTNPSKIKFLMVLGPRGKSIAEGQQLFQADKNYFEKLNYLRVLKDVPNIQGDWYPSFGPRCPICNSFMSEIKDYKVVFGKLVCPQCGYEKMK